MLLINIYFINCISNTTQKTYLYQDDFKNSSYIIKESGYYILAQNIIFDPPSKVPFHLMRFNKAFRIGFFAAIVIQADNVTLDLNGYEIKQSMQHYLNQRFYAHIELGNSPFLPGKGPQDFTDTFIAAKNVIIQNGVLGLSSHHGIHGNKSQNIIIRDLVIKDFEVGGIAINIGQDITIQDVKIGPTSNIVAINGGYSAAINILLYLETLYKGQEVLQEDEIYILIKEQKINIEQIYFELKDLIEKTQYHFYRQEYDQIPELFKNIDMIPDGGVVYGIVLNNKELATGPFNNKEHDENNISKNIIINNVVIQDLSLKVNERIALQIEGETKKSNFTKAQIDSIGSSFNVLQSMNEDGSYKYNPLANAQLIICKYKKQIQQNQAALHKMHLYLTDTSRDSISQEVLEWASKLNGHVKHNFICNADQMLHSIKGSIPLRLSGIINANIQNIIIQNIYNYSDFGSQLCGNYLQGTSFENTLNGYQGADIRGITIESCTDIFIQNTLLQNMKSYQGSVTGVVVMFKSKNIRGDLKIKNMDCIKQNQLPKNFDQISQNIPQTKDAIVSQESDTILTIQNDDQIIKTITNKDNTNKSQQIFNRTENIILRDQFTIDKEQKFNTINDQVNSLEIDKIWIGFVSQDYMNFESPYKQYNFNQIFKLHISQQTWNFKPQQFIKLFFSETQAKIIYLVFYYFKNVQLFIFKRQNEINLKCLEKSNYIQKYSNFQSVQTFRIDFVILSTQYYQKIDFKIAIVNKIDIKQLEEEFKRCQKNS